MEMPGPTHDVREDALDPFAAKPPDVASCG
jgi:hypothetical protein